MNLSIPYGDYKLNRASILFEGNSIVERECLRSVANLESKKLHCSRPKNSVLTYEL